jgi:hypothetical protein
MTTTTIVLNTEEDPVRIRILGYYTVNGDMSETIKLIEVYEAFYKHPEASEHALLPRIETRIVKEYHRRSTSDGAICVLLEAAEKAILKIT